MLCHKSGWLTWLKERYKYEGEKGLSLHFLLSPHNFPATNNEVTNCNELCSFGNLNSVESNPELFNSASIVFRYPLIEFGNYGANPTGERVLLWIKQEFKPIPRKPNEKTNFIPS